VYIEVRKDDFSENGRPMIASPKHVDFSSESEFTGALRATNAALVVVGLEDVEMRTETGPPSTRTR